MTQIAAPPSERLGARPSRGTLPVVLAAAFMAGLDFFIVNVAIPATQRDLAAGPAAVEWIVAGYGLPYGALLITGGRLGDLWGRRRTFAAGLAMFTAASAACGLAPSAGFLIAGRVVQGAAAALLSPQVLVVLRSAYHGRAQLRAFNVYATTLGVAAVFGQLIGGVLIRADVFGLDWRACYLVNIPIGLAALALTPRLVPAIPGTAHARLDIPGLALVTLALVATVLPLIEGRVQGWPVWTWVSLAVAAVLFAAVGLSQRRATAPLIDLALFRERAFTAGLVTLLAFWMSMAGYFLIFALYVQPGRGMDALQAGLIFAPMGAGYMLTSSVAGHLGARHGRVVIACGGLLRFAGLALMLVTVHRIGVGGSAGWLVPALVVDGAGMGLVVAPVTSSVLARVATPHAGAASGLLATVQQVGNALGVAVVGVVFYGALHGGYAHAFSYGLIYAAAASVAVVAAAQALPRKATAPRD